MKPIEKEVKATPEIECEQTGLAVHGPRDVQISRIKTGE